MGTRWNEHDRARLAQALRDAGPGAPTLCEGWRTQELAAHLVLREHKPWASRGRTFESVAADARDRAGFDALVARFAQRPARWSPAGWAGEPMNLLEHYVHCEDVLRAPGAPRAVALDAAHEAALWNHFKRFSKLLYRRSPVGVTLALPDGTRAVARRAPSGEPTREVVVTGEPGELVLHGFGRGTHARVTLEGSAADVAALVARFPGPQEG